MNKCYRLHGWTVSAPFPVGRDAGPGGHADVFIRVSEGSAADGHDEVPDGRLIASYADDKPRYSLVDRAEHGYLYRFHGYVDIDISPGLGQLHCRLRPGVDKELLPILVEGNVMAALMLLRGQCVLHASAVERNGQAVALVGPSGAGKSTLAAMACLGGARFLTDDVLRVEATGPCVTCHPGGVALRLRPGSRALDTLEQRPVGESVDGRHLMAFEPATDDVTLEAIMLPRLCGPDHPISRTALRGSAALLAVLGIPRVWNWSDVSTAADHFTTLASVVDRVPVFRLEVPRDLTASSGWPERIADSLFAPE